MRVIFAGYYDEKIGSEYLKTYINARYYNIRNTEKPARAFYLRILDELEFKQNILIRKNEEEAENSNNYVTEILDSLKAGKNEEEGNKISSTDSPQKIPIKTDKVINTSPMISPAQKKIQIIQLPLKKIKVEGEESNLSDRPGSGKKISASATVAGNKTKVLRKSPSPKRQINLNKTSSPGKGIKKESKEIKK